MAYMNLDVRDKVMAAARLSEHDEDPTVFPQVAKLILAKSNANAEANGYSDSNTIISVLMDLTSYAKKRMFAKDAIDNHDVQLSQLIADIDSSLDNPYIEFTADYCGDLARRAKEEGRRDIFNHAIAVLSIVSDARRDDAEFRSRATYAMVEMDPFWDMQGDIPDAKTQFMSQSLGRSLSRGAFAEDILNMPVHYRGIIMAEPYFTERLKYLVKAMQRRTPCRENASGMRVTYDQEILDFVTDVVAKKPVFGYSHAHWVATFMDSLAYRGDDKQNQQILTMLNDHMVPNMVFAFKPAHVMRVLLIKNDYGSVATMGMLDDFKQAYTEHMPEQLPILLKETLDMLATNATGIKWRSVEKVSKLRADCETVVSGVKDMFKHANQADLAYHYHQAASYLEDFKETIDAIPSDAIDSKKYLLSTYDRFKTIIQEKQALPTLVRHKTPAQP